MGQSLKSYALFSREDSLVPRIPVPFESPRGLWLAVHCPGIVFPAGSFSSNEPAVVIGRREIAVIAVNGAASRSGVAIGMKPRAAMAACSRLQIFEQSIEAQQARLERLASCAFAFTPKISLEPPREFLLEIAGSLKLFGGLAALKAQLLRALGHERCCLIAAAPTPLAAIWAARAGSRDLLAHGEFAGALGALDLGVTGWPESIRSTLREMGVRTLADCFRLPRAGFSRRIGKQYLRDLDKASGAAPDVRSPFLPAAHLSYLSESPYEVKTSEILLSQIEPLLSQLVAELQARQAEIRVLEIVLSHVQGHRTVQRVELVDPTCQRDRLLRLLVDKFERLEFRAPVIAVELRAEQLLSMNAPQTKSLWLGGEECALEIKESAKRLVELLRGRLGIQNVFSVRQVAEHRPERAWKKVVFGEPERAISTLPGSDRRPLWLLPSAVRLEGQEWPWYEGHRLALVSGPERIETGWWDCDVRRDYYCAVAVTGEILWVYRERSRPIWYLHGWFG